MNCEVSKMASNKDFVEEVVNRLSNAGDVTYKRLFGEYGIYLDSVFIGAICDNQLFFKVTKQGRECLKEEVLAPMYKGAKPSFLIEEIYDEAYLCMLAQKTKLGLIK